MRFYGSLNLTVGAVTVVPIPTTNLANGSNGGRAFLGLIEVHGAAIYYTLDGSIPSSSNGFQESVGTRFEVRNYDNLSQIKFLSQGGTATLHIEFAQ